ncbi:unnamed protein product, partial [Iphiclides podalirius]
MVVGYGDACIKIFDMATQELDTTYKVQKLRLQVYSEETATPSYWTGLRVTLRRTEPFHIWDIRCKSGCVTTFEGVNICSDSIDLNRNQCVVGSWQPTEALTVWDIVAKKKVNTIRVQNRRPDVDGEYIYACRYWKSTDFNRKGKYALIGGSGTNCLEVINLHNRYISCSYHTAGTILAIASHQERIAYGGTAPFLTIVSFHDPKHERYKSDIEDDPSLWTPGNDFLSHSTTTLDQYEN